jgi:hypothetical protein
MDLGEKKPALMTRAIQSARRQPGLFGGASAAQ